MEFIWNAERQIPFGTRYAGVFSDGKDLYKVVAGTRGTFAASANLVEKGGGSPVKITEKEYQEMKEAFSADGLDLLGETLKF